MNLVKPQEKRTNFKTSPSLSIQLTQLPLVIVSMPIKTTGMKAWHTQKGPIVPTCRTQDVGVMEVEAGKVTWTRLLLMHLQMKLKHQLVLVSTTQLHGPPPVPFIDCTSVGFLSL